MGLTQKQFKYVFLERERDKVYFHRRPFGRWWPWTIANFADALKRVCPLPPPPEMGERFIHTSSAALSHWQGCIEAH